MTFDAGTWWLAVLLLGFVTAGLVYLLKRSLFGRIDKLDESMKEISENSVKKSDYESTVQSLQADIKQIRADYTPRAEHRKDLDECRGDIKQIKADYITKEDFFREQAKTDRKLDRIMDIPPRVSTLTGRPWTTTRPGTPPQRRWAICSLPGKQARPSRWAPRFYMVHWPLKLQLQRRSAPRDNARWGLNARRREPWATWASAPSQPCAQLFPA